MHDVPMLADFSVRLAFGLAVLLLFTSWRVVPLNFFRTHCLVILGLLILAALDASRVLGLHGSVWLLVCGAVFSYIATVSWGLGLPRVAVPATVIVVVSALGWLGFTSWSDVTGVWLLNTASRCASAFLLGATLTAMLLGHHYLIAPAMSIDPLKRYVRFMAWGLGARGAIALAAILLSRSGIGGALPSTFQEASSPLFLTMRWGMGFLGPAVATLLAWKTVQIRSTQSATGILYVAMTLVLFGELSSLIEARAGGLIC